MMLDGRSKGTKLIGRSCNLFPKELFSSIARISLRIQYVELSRFLLEYASIVHSFRCFLLLFISEIIISITVLIVQNVSHFVPLL